MEKFPRIHPTDDSSHQHSGWVFRAAVLSVLVAGCGVPVDRDSEASELEAPDNQSPIVALTAYAQVSDSLVSEMFIVDPLAAIPARILVSGDHLVVAEAQGDPNLNVYDLETGTRLWSEGRDGQGPGEFAGSPQPLRSQPDSAGRVWFLDGVLRRFVGINLLEPPSRQQPEVSRSVGVKPQESTSLIAAVLLNSHTIVAATERTDGPPVLRRIDVTTGAASGDPVGLSQLNTRIPEAYQSTSMALRMCGHPSGGRFVVLYSYAGRAEIRDSLLGSVASMEVPLEFVPPVMRRKVTGQRFFSPGTAGMRRGYIDCQADAQHIFALFSGVLGSATTGRGAWHESYIHVFDWDGKLVNVWHLDHGPHSFAIDSRSNSLYSATMGVDGESPQVRRASLPLDIGT